jgi:hypothetical protein
MENYLNKYDTLEKKIVYNFSVGMGGIGDLTKFFMHLLKICIEHNIKLHYLVNNIQIEKYLKLKHAKMYITEEELTNNRESIHEEKLISNIKPAIFYVVIPQVFWSNYDSNNVHYNLQDVFYFPDEVKQNGSLFFNNDINYISIHLRLGDKYLETDESFIVCKDDTRNYNEDNIFNFIETNYDKNILFFCDNRNYKLKIKNKYSKIIITDYEIGHTSLFNTTDKQVLDTVTELYLMTNSEHIYTASYSGFSIVAAAFKGIPITKI